MHGYTLILTLAFGFSLALVLGYATQRLVRSPILGYLIAGFLVGPRTPGFVADAGLATELAEVGVILLMFGVGLHFHLKDLLAVRAIALPGAVVQSLVATGFGALTALAFGWTLGAGIVLGIAISVASTVVLMRVLMDAEALSTPHGRIAVGWLIVEDIFTVVALVLLPVVGAGGVGAGAIAGSLAWAAVKLAILVAIMLVIGARAIPWTLTQVARTRSRELFTLAVLAIALAIAAGSAALFGASMALGAFLAGMVVGQSEVSHQAAADALPMRDAFAVLFFLSVGMLFDPALLVTQPGLVLAVLAIILVAKPLAALGIVLVLGYPVRSAITVALGLAQIGEFSFILADAARKIGLLPAEGQSVLVVCALISIALNPPIFRRAHRIEAWLRSHRRLWALLNRRVDREGRALEKIAQAPTARGGVRAVVAGYGPVGETVTEILRDFGVEPVVIELNVDAVKRVKQSGIPAIFGDASRREILESAGVADARYLLLTIPDPESRQSVVAAARALNPDVKVIARARFVKERAALQELGVSAVAIEEVEAAVGLARLLLVEVGAETSRIEAEAARIRAKYAI